MKCMGLTGVGRWEGEAEGRLTNAVDGPPLREPLLDMVRHAARRLGVVRVVEVVVVDVEDGVRVRLSGGLEGDADEVLAEDLREDGLPEGAVLVEHFVDDVLGEGVSLLPLFSSRPGLL